MQPPPAAEAAGYAADVGIASSWGTRAEERAAAWPCDTWPEGEADAYYRGVSVAAPPERVFRWLCQLRVAPYSYDWIDNGGRRSPPRLTPGLERLAPGQTFMTLFELASFCEGRELTLRTKPGRGERLFGRVGITYRVVPLASRRSRLLAKLRVAHAPGLPGRVAARLLPWGDLLMMRRQLLNLKGHAEAEARAARG